MSSHSEDDEPSRTFDDMYVEPFMREDYTEREHHASHMRDEYDALSHNRQSEEEEEEDEDYHRRLLLSAASAAVAPPRLFFFALPPNIELDAWDAYRHMRDPNQFDRLPIWENLANLRMAAQWARDTLAALPDHRYLNRQYQWVQVGDDYFRLVDFKQKVTWRVSCLEQQYQRERATYLLAQEARREQETQKAASRVKREEEEEPQAAPAAWDAHDSQTGTPRNLLPQSPYE